MERERPAASRASLTRRPGLAVSRAPLRGGKSSHPDPAFRRRRKVAAPTNRRRPIVATAGGSLVILLLAVLILGMFS